MRHIVASMSVLQTDRMHNREMPRPQIGWGISCKVLSLCDQVFVRSGSCRSICSRPTHQVAAFALIGGAAERPDGDVIFATTNASEGTLQGFALMIKETLDFVRRCTWLMDSAKEDCGQFAEDVSE